jgi:hypothetical protein
VLEALPDSFVATRDSLHAVAEHVLAPFRHRADGHIGLAPAPGGFGTPPLAGGVRAHVDGVELVHERPGASTRVRLTTVGAAAQFLGIEPGLPAGIYTPATPFDPDAHLDVAGDGAHALATWLAFADSLLAELRSDYAGHDATPATLWPEHFDLACEIGDAAAGTRANYGASPGDGAIAEPYLYVGPWEASRRAGPLGTRPWGAAITYGELLASGDSKGAALDFLRAGAAVLLGTP